jgi:hypothetical protein
MVRGGRRGAEGAATEGADGGAARQIGQWNPVGLQKRERFGGLCWVMTVSAVPIAEILSAPERLFEQPREFRDFVQGRLLR